VSTIGERLNANSVVAMEYAIMEDRRPCVKNAVEAVFASTEERSADVKNAVAMVYAITGSKRDIVEIVEAVHYVFTEERSADVKNVEAVVCVFPTSKSTAALNANRSKGKLISSVLFMIRM
jgi:hypothetical protein